jgi:predicted ArsR family transcriptional regulator
VQRNTVTIARNAQRTSIAAAQRVLPRTGSIRKKIYDYLQATGGATDEQIEDALHISGNSVRPSRGSLVNDGLVYDTGREHPTKSGNMAIIWAVA